jgi:hypothetical protein
MTMLKEITKDKYAVLSIIVFSLLCTITYSSTNLTLSFFGSIGSGRIMISNWLMGFTNDLTKIIIPFVINVFGRGNKVLTVFLSVIMVVTMFISYMASQAIDLNINNATKQDMILSSNTYKSKQQDAEDKRNQEIENRNLINSQIASLNNSLESQREVYKSNIAELQEQKDNVTVAGEWNRLNEKKKIQNVIDIKMSELKDIESETTTKIEQLTMQLIAIGNNANDTTAVSNESQLDDTENVELLSTTGYESLSVSMGWEVDSILKFKNIFGEVLSITLSITLSMLLHKVTLFRRKEEDVSEGEDTGKPESIDTDADDDDNNDDDMTGSVCVNNVMDEEDTRTEEDKIAEVLKSCNVSQESNESQCEDVVRNKIGFVQDKNEHEQEEMYIVDSNVLEKYKKEMVKPENTKVTKNGVMLLGYKKLRDIADITEGEAKNCYLYLKSKNMFQIIGNRTYLKEALD